MHPAASIIAFTVASGLGYGLAFFLGLGFLDPDAPATRAAHVLALALIAGGLMSSTLHLGNPRRAWRAFSQWRSSWLSREGVLALASFAPLALAAWASVVDGRALPPAGLAGAALAAATVYSTSMIYASLKSVEAWATPLTSACYLLFAAAGGAVVATFVAASGGGLPAIPGLAALVALAAAWAVKRRWRGRMLALRSASTPETATGLRFLGKVRLFERPHMTENYLTREMGFRVARKHADKLWRIALLLGGGVPIVLIATVVALPDGFGTLSIVLSGLAVAAHVVGMLVERWLFFAEARHAVMNYYGG